MPRRRPRLLIPTDDLVDHEPWSGRSRALTKHGLAEPAISPAFIPSEIHTSVERKAEEFEWAEETERGTHCIYRRATHKPSGVSMGVKVISEDGPQERWSVSGLIPQLQARIIADAQYAAPCRAVRLPWLTCHSRMLAFTMALHPRVGQESAARRLRGLTGTQVLTLHRHCTVTVPSLYHHCNWVEASWRSFVST